MKFSLSVFVNVIKNFAHQSREAYLKEEITLKELDIIINRLQMELSRMEGF